MREAKPTEHVLLILLKKKKKKEQIDKKQTLILKMHQRTTENG